MSSPTQTVLGWLLTYLVHSTALLGAAWAANRWLVRSPAIREAVWKTALIAGLVTSTAQTAGVAPVTGGYSMAVSPRHEVPVALPTVAGEGHQLTVALPSQPEVQPTPFVESVRSRTIAKADVAVGLWFVGATFLVLGFAVRRWQLARRLGVRRPVTNHPIVAELDELREEAGVRGAVMLTVSDRLASPIAVGVSEICVPAIALRELDRQERGSMLAHELAHLIRYDTIWLTVAALIERVFFFQPLNRVARRGIQADAELLCDEWAATRLGSGLTMAKCLVKVAEWIDAAPRPIPIAGMAEERSHLVDRVQRLVEEGPVSVKPRRRVVLASVAGLIVVTALVAPNVSLVGQGERERDRNAAELDNADPDVLHPVPGKALQDTSSSVVAALATALKDQSPAVRRAAASSLGNLRSRRATSALIAAIGDEDTEVRHAVVEALGELEDAEAIPALRTRLDDSSKEVRHAAIEALREFKDGLDIGLIRTWATDADADVRQFAARALGERKDRASSAALIKLLGDPKSEVRAAAANALGELEDGSAVDALSQALKDEDNEVREAALDALGELDLKEAPAGVIEALSSGNASVRASAARLVGNIGDRRAVPALRTLLGDVNAEVRKSAVDALGEIRDQPAIDALVVALKSSDAVVRTAAAEALGQRRD